MIPFIDNATGEKNMKKPYAYAVSKAPNVFAKDYYGNEWTNDERDACKFLSYNEANESSRVVKQAMCEAGDVRGALFVLVVGL